MQLEWKFHYGTSSTSIHTPDHSLPLFLPGTGYVTPINAAHQIVNLAKTNKCETEWRGWQGIQYQVQVIFKGKMHYLQIINNSIRVFFGYERYAYAYLTLWPRNARNLKDSIVSTLNLLNIADVHLS